MGSASSATGAKAVARANCSIALCGQYSDAAVGHDSTFLASVIRDHNGTIISVTTAESPFEDPLMAEAQALQLSLSSASLLKISRVGCESDSV
ncbi:hypothetical protein L484_010193 [Morus notabilis]|uniref:RNase H type-1 domain-containing protein n=1 Tax=Morus notabilis TaxID=981085 RepID=W9QQD7_9ROSA|nr:hypothetical protein L484_010193 [Morus notabilis]